MADWHTILERRLIELHGGTWEPGDGPDGTHDGHPVEVRAARKEDRFRLNKDTHREMVRDDGHYIFAVLGNWSQFCKTDP